MDISVSFTVNGQAHSVKTDAERPLLDVLREDLHLTGSKYGCGEGKCRACTVFIDDKPALSCVTPVGKVDGKSIVTIEGLATGGKLHPVQEAFLAEGAMQCGYCTPGMVMQTTALLRAKPHPTDAEIIDWLEGSLCRCCGYVRIVAAVRRAAGTLGEGSKS
jgi:aerobic-type carbon monoxide dehydrogenase small subunit (CoxS/CutS family)